MYNQSPGKNGGSGAGSFLEPRREVQSTAGLSIYAKQIGVDAYLLDMGQGLGQVADVRRGILFAPVDMQSLLNWAYWVAYTEEQDRLPSLLQNVVLPAQPVKLQTVGDYQAKILYHLEEVKYIVACAPGQGQILDMEERLLYPAYDLEALQKRNHWQRYTGEQRVLTTLLTQVQMYQRPAYLSPQLRVPIKIIAHSGMRRFLVQTLSGHGRVLDLELHALYLPMGISSIMSNDPYWEEYTGSQDALKSFLRQVREVAIPETGQGPRPGSGRTQADIERELRQTFTNRPVRLTSYRRVMS